MTYQLFTIGYSNSTADEFVTLLKRHEITVLVDVRSAPSISQLSLWDKQR